MTTAESLSIQLNTVYGITGETNMAIVTTDFVKSYLGIEDTTYDVKITSLIPLCEQAYLDIRNVPFKEVDSVTEYPIGSDVTISEMIGFKLGNSSLDKVGKVISSENIDSYSVSYVDNLTSGIGGYPKEIVSSIKRYCDGR